MAYEIVLNFCVCRITESQSIESFDQTNVFRIKSWPYMSTSVFTLSCYVHCRVLRDIKVTVLHDIKILISQTCVNVRCYMT